MSSNQNQEKPTERPVRRSQTASAQDFRPPTLRHQGEDTDQTASTMGQISTIQSRDFTNQRPSNPRNDTAATQMTQQTRDTAMRHQDTLERERTMKKQQQEVTVDNDYYSLNPWYDQAPEKPVFGLAQPLPREIRKGMLWGRPGGTELQNRPLYKIEKKDKKKRERPSQLESEEPIIRDQGEGPLHHGQASDGLEVPLDDDQHSSGSDVGPDDFETIIDGEKVRARKLSRQEADHVLQGRGTGSQWEHHPSRGIDEHGLEFPNHSEKQTHRNQFGLQDGLPPLQHHKSSDSSTSSQTQKEHQEIQARTEQAAREYYNQYRNPLARLRARYPQPLAELLSTFIALFLGLAGNLSVLTSDSTQGGFQTQAWAWGLSVMTGIYIGGGISGAHLNPCVSVSLSLFRGFPWRMCVAYVLAQLFAGFCAAGLAYCVYHDSIHYYDPGLTADVTGKAFYTIPQPWASPSSAFFTEFVSAAIMICTIFALGDDQNAPPGAGMSALILGLVIYLLTITLGYNTGPAISPARDFGPRLVALFVGYGKQTFTTGWWAYGPWGAAFSGSIVGALLYDTFIFVGTESPVNYRWPKPGEVKWRAIRAKDVTKDVARDAIHHMV